MKNHYSLFLEKYTRNTIFCNFCVLLLFYYDVFVKKIHFPKITFPFFRKEDPVEPLWKIQTKIYSPQREQISKIRKNKPEWWLVIKQCISWCKNYIKNVGWIFLLWIFLSFWIAVFATPYFQLHPDKIEVEYRPKELASWFDQKNIMSILRNFSGKNIFSISDREIFDTLSESTRHIYSLEKSLLLSDGIKITLTSFPVKFRVLLGEEVYLLTENGQLINDIPEITNIPDLEVNHLISDPLLDKKTSISMNHLEIIDIVGSQWNTEFPEFPLTALRFYEQEMEIHIISNNTHFIVQMHTAIEKLKELQKLIQTGKINPKLYTYIDLRVGWRIYVCPLWSRECITNLTETYSKN